MSSRHNRAREKEVIGPINDNKGSVETQYVGIYTLNRSVKYVGTITDTYEEGHDGSMVQHSTVQLTDTSGDEGFADMNLKLLHFFAKNEMYENRGYTHAPPSMPVEFENEYIKTLVLLVWEMGSERWSDNKTLYATVQKSKGKTQRLIYCVSNTTENHGINVESIFNFMVDQNVMITHMNREIEHLREQERLTEEYLTQNAVYGIHVK